MGLKAGDLEPHKRDMVVSLYKHFGYFKRKVDHFRLGSTYTAAYKAHVDGKMVFLAGRMESGGDRCRD